MNSAIRTKAGGWLSWLGTSNWHRIFVSNKSRSNTLNLWKSFASFVESLYIATLHYLDLIFETCWEKSTASRLIPLKKMGFNAMVSKKVGCKN